MIRQNLDAIPDFKTPDGFQLRWYRAGDEATWLRIHEEADLHNQIRPQLFVQQFGTDTKALGQRQCYLLSSTGEPMGTATAWFNNSIEGRKMGRVHWVALLPKYQGRGLSKPLMTAICQRLLELGHRDAYLVTWSTLIPAIQLYRRFGFEPWIRNENEKKLWEQVEREWSR